MKKLIIILFYCLLAIGTHAQVAKKTFDSRSIVKGEDGTVYPYAIWSKLLETGSYTIKLGSNDEFTLVKLTPEQAARNLELRKNAIKNLPKPRTSESFVEGKKFDGDRFVSLNKTKFDLKKPSDRIYVINFWFIDCAPCKKEIPELNELVKKYQDRDDIVFLAVALDNSYDLKQFLASTPFNYHVIPDGRYFSQKYGVKAYPTHVIVGKDGVIKFSTLGLAPNTIEWIDKTIQSL